MGQAEIIAGDEVRARQRQETSHQKLRACFERWLECLEEHMSEANATLLETTPAMGDLCQNRTDRLTTVPLQYTHEAEYVRQQAAREPRSKQSEVMVRDTTW